MEYQISPDSALFFLSVFLILISLFKLFCTPFKRKKTRRLTKRDSWRVNQSKRWLSDFRKTKTTLTTQQRFSYIRRISDPFLFEEILMTCFDERDAVLKIRRTKYTRDGGIDGFVYFPGLTVLIQAKLYSGPISKQHVISFTDTVNVSNQDTKGLFIHTGKTSEPIKKLVYSCPNVEMISGVNRLLAFLDGEPVSVFGFSI